MLRINRKLNVPFYIIDEDTNTVIAKIAPIDVYMYDNKQYVGIAVNTIEGYDVKRLGKKKALPEKIYNAIIEFEQHLLEKRKTQ